MRLSPHTAQAATNAPFTGRAAPGSMACCNFTILRRRQHPCRCFQQLTQARASSYLAAPFSTNSCLGVTINFLVTSDPAEVCTLSGQVSPLRGPIRSITERLSLPPPSFTRCSFGSPYGVPTLSEGEQRAYHVPLVYPHGLGPSSTPGAHRLR